MDVAELIYIVVDCDRWPTYRNTSELSRLEKLAREAYGRNTFDGYLSYVLMMHQVSEDYVLILLKHAQLALAVSLALQGFGWKLNATLTGDKLDGQMFGRLLDLLDNSTEFDGKERLIRVCREMNQTRNRLAHRLVSGIELQELASLATEFQAKCRELIDLFNNADEEFSYFYSIVIHETNWDRIINTNIESAAGASNGEEVLRWESARERLHQGRTESKIKNYPNNE